MEFSNIDDLAKYIESTYGMKSMLDSGGDIQIALKQAADLLRESIQIYIDEFYMSYHPSVYVRTFDFENSLRVSPVITDGINYSIEVFFDENKATHHSIFGGEDGYLPFLLNDGWQWHDDQAQIYRLSHYDGFHFVEKGIDRFNTMNKWNFIVVMRRSVG